MNGFEIHKIEHLSPSQIVNFQESPAAWAMDKVAGVKSEVGPAAHRGSAVEDALNAAASRWTEGGQMSDADMLKAAQDSFLSRLGIETGGRELTSQEMKEFKALGGYIAEAAPVISGMFQKNAHRRALFGVDQHKIEAQASLRGGGKIKVIGYTDYFWPEVPHIVDLKTSGQMRSEMPHAHLLQAAIYWHATGRRADVDFVYATPRRSLVRNVPVEDLKRGLKQANHMINRMERFLAAFKTSEELLAAVPLDFGGFRLTKGEDALNCVFKYPVR